MNHLQAGNGNAGRRNSDWVMRGEAQLIPRLISANMSPEKCAMQLPVWQQRAERQSDASGAIEGRPRRNTIRPRQMNLDQT